MDKLRATNYLTMLTIPADSTVALSLQTGPA